MTDSPAHQRSGEPTSPHLLLWCVPPTRPTDAEVYHFVANGEFSSILTMAQMPLGFPEAFPDRSVHLIRETVRA